MARSMGSNNSNLLRLVEERVLLKKVDEEPDKQEETLVPYLPNDCISKILIRLSLQSLSGMRFVCKPWYNIISSAKFINEHLRCSESGLIFQAVVSYPVISNQSEQPNTFSVEGSRQAETFSIWHPVKRTSKFYIQFMEFKEGKVQTKKYNVSCLGQIRATCNGLILLDNNLKKGGLIVMNPVTKKLVALPVGTVFPLHNESYGFGLNEVTGEYKVAHLFQDELGYIGCETLNLGMRMWREVNGPSFGAFGWFGYSPISAIGALHWVPQIDNNDYVVSMAVNNEKFLTICLPKTCRTHDRIMEQGGLLCFVTHEELHIDIWILKGICNEIWTKRHRITRGSMIDMVPLFSLRISGDIIFMRDEDDSFYSYDFSQELMTKIEMEEGFFPLYISCLPHVNSLVSWERGQDLCDCCFLAVRKVMACAPLSCKTLSFWVKWLFYIMRYVLSLPFISFCFSLFVSSLFVIFAV